MDLFFEQLINGCALGSLYALFAIGFGLVFATLGILNAAHGTYATWAAIAAYEAVDALGLPFPLAVVIGVVAGGLLALAVDQAAFQPLRARRAGMLGALITSIACWIILDTLADAATGHQSLSFPLASYPSGMVHLGEVQFAVMQGVAIGALIVVTIAMHLLVRHSRFGAAMRAVGWNEAAAALSGVNPHRVVAATAFLAGATSGLAGVLGSISTQNVSYTLGEGLMLKGFAAVVVGGYDDVRGAAVAGVALGVLEVMTAQYISSSLRDGITYALLLGFLLLRPRGLFGGTAFTRA
jgi:branched-chain amino acid transport system permease protein